MVYNVQENNRLQHRIFPPQESGFVYFQLWLPIDLGYLMVLWAVLGPLAIRDPVASRIRDLAMRLTGLPPAVPKDPVEWSFLTALTRGEWCWEPYADYLQDSPDPEMAGRGQLMSSAVMGVKVDQ